MAPHRPSPIGPRESFSTVWTGHELIVFGGSSGDGLATPAGAAYDPASDRWQALAAAPIGAWTALLARHRSATESALVRGVSEPVGFVRLTIGPA